MEVSIEKTHTYLNNLTEAFDQSALASRSIAILTATDPTASPMTAVAEEFDTLSTKTADVLLTWLAVNFFASFN